jgi:hypothetical protein
VYMYQYPFTQQLSQAVAQTAHLLSHTCLSGLQPL